MDNLYFLKPALNKKKLIITILMILFLLGICIVGRSIFYKNKTNPVVNKKTYLIDNNFNITLNNLYNLKEYKSANYFLLELHSENNFNFYIKKLDNLDDYSLYMITKNDSYSFVSNFENVTEISNINNLNISSLESYNYNFKYLDSISNSTYFIQVYLIKIGDSIYSFTADFPVSSIDIFNPFVSDIINSVTLIND